MNRIRFAVDLGTTTVDTCLIDADTQRIIAEKSFKNRQSLYGSDVINRILTVTRDNKYLKLMKDMVVSDIAEALNAMLEASGIAADSIDLMCICGNTAMISILLEYDISDMGAFPFKHRLNSSVKCNSRDLLSCDFPVCCEVILSGCAGAFIGGDVLAGMIHLGLNKNYKFDDAHISLLLDFGTNGEMVLNNRGDYYAVSTACGPAFENCTRKQNVFGSGVIDAIALGLKTGNISADGALKDEFIDRGLDIMGVHLDMDIIRQILMAKAAIYTGIQFLVNEEGIAFEDIDEVYLAGGFGFYLNVKSAADIGLLPAAFIIKTVSVGNTSLKGACDILVSESVYERLNGLTDKNSINILQLAQKDKYQEELIGNMTFKSEKC